MVSGGFMPQSPDPQYSLDRRLGGPQSWSGYGGKEKNPIIAPVRNGTPTIQPKA